MMSDTFFACLESICDNAKQYFVNFILELFCIALPANSDSDLSYEI